MYRVVWTDDAFAQMAQIVADHPRFKRDLSEALKRMTDELLSDPAEAGESRSGRLRIAFYGPLSVYFQVFSPQRRVLIVAIHVGRHPRGWRD